MIKGERCVWLGQPVDSYVLSFLLFLVRLDRLSVVVISLRRQEVTGLQVA